MSAPSSATFLPIRCPVVGLGVAMRRRDFIKVIGGGAAVWPLAAQAQKPAMPVIGYLAAGYAKADARLVAAFVKGLGETGYEEGKTVQIEYRWAEISMIDCRRWQPISFAARWCDRSDDHTGGTCGKSGDGDDSHCLHHDRRSGADRVRRQSEPPGWQCYRRDHVKRRARTETVGIAAWGCAFGHYRCVCSLIRPIPMPRPSRKILRRQA